MNQLVRFLYVGLLGIFMLSLISCQTMPKSMKNIRRNKKFNCVIWANYEAKRLKDNGLKNSGVFRCHIKGSKTLHHAIWILDGNRYILYDKKNIIDTKDIDGYWGWWVGPMIWEEQDKNWEGHGPPWIFKNADDKEK